MQYSISGAMIFNSSPTKQWAMDVNNHLLGQLLFNNSSH